MASYDEQGYVDESQAALTGAASGAAAGATAGPVGALFGGIIGAGLGIYNANRQNSALRKAQQAQNRARVNAAYRRQIARQQAAALSASTRSNVPQGGRTPRVNSQPPQQQQGIIGQNVSNVVSSSGTF